MSLTQPVVRQARVPPGPRLSAGALLVAAGCAALLARPWLFPRPGSATGELVLLFVALGAAGLCWRFDPARAEALPPPRTAILALAMGTLAFGLTRLLTGDPAPSTALAAALVLNSLAAVAEEAFFRRLLYGLLAPFGTGVAIVGSAALFAFVHVTVWGLWVLPLDLAAGLVLSWQRAASGRWSVPAATHVLANILAFK